MNYLATELPGKPYIFWQSTEIKDGALILPEASIPAMQFGVYPIKIEGGQLVQRSAAEMAAFETEYNAKVIQDSYSRKADALQTATFAYKGVNYPMHLTARLYYSVMQRTPGDYSVLSTTGATPILQAANTEFLDAFYSALKTLTQP